MGERNEGRGKERNGRKESYLVDWLVLTGLMGTARWHTELAFDSQAWLSVKSTSDIPLFNKSL